MNFDPECVTLVSVLILLRFQRSGQAHPCFPTLFSMSGGKPVTRLSSQDWEKLGKGFKPQNSCSWSQSPSLSCSETSASKKVISKERLFLVRYHRWVHCPWRRREKNRRNQEPVLWWLPSRTVVSLPALSCSNTFPGAVPRLNACHAVFPTTLHVLGSKIRAPQACSLVLFLFPPSPPAQEMSRHSGDEDSF